MPLRDELTREGRVAFSRRAQPVWFRITKWVVAIGVGTRLWHTPYFWRTIAVVLALSLAGHFFWRWKTKGWTEPWGGWNDVDTAKKR